MIDELANAIWKEPRFHSDLKLARTSSLRSQLLGERVQADKDHVKRLLEASLILSASSSELHMAGAYSAVTSLSNTYGREFSSIPYALHTVLSQIGNFPAQRFADERFGTDAEFYPPKALAQQNSRQIANTMISSEELFLLTDFQAALWRDLRDSRSVTISAPTSAGKSFVLQSYLREQVRSRGSNHVGFVVPSRALINQVSADIARWIHEIAGAEIITTPVPENFALPEVGVFVLTQERLQLLFTNHPQFSLEIMVVDEAQSLGSGPRGILLSNVIGQNLNRNPQCQVIFAGPNLSNPEVLAKPFGLAATPAVSVRPTVDQNIVFVDVDEVFSNRLHLSSLVEGEKVSVGVCDLIDGVEDHIDRLVRIPAELGRSGQSLIYAFGPAEAEKVAIRLADALGEVTADDDLEQLANFLGEAIHRRFPVIEAVRKGIGVHYGRLPGLVRKSLEDAFATGKLRFLATTSTLLQGVNLPAKNLFLHNPYTGTDNPISPTDFWNLAGRAGRLGKEFSGNIFLVDYGKWHSEPLSGEKEREIRPTLLSHLHEQSEELFSYMSNPDAVPDRDNQDEYENTFLKLYDDWRENRLIETFRNAGVDPEGTLSSRMSTLFSKIEQEITISDKTFKASPTVSIYRQQALYERILKSIQKKGPAYVIPKHPMNSDAYFSLVGVLKRCHDEVMKFPRAEKSHLYFATIALQWMRGAPLPKIIDSAYDHKKRNGQNPAWGSLIRQVLTDIERNLRFRYVRLLSCYDATLKEALVNSGHEDTLKAVPALPLYIEVGASSSTMISLLGLGISRFTAGRLNEIIADRNLDLVGARRWLKERNLDLLDVPAASTRELRRIIG